MEKTIEQREKHNEYQKKWREENKEKFKQSQIKYREKNKDRIKEYLTNYYKENREHIRNQQKEYRENNVYLDAVYFFINEDEDEDSQTLYIGSSARLNERISNHMTNHSNLKMTAEELANVGLRKIIYKNFSEYGLSRSDLFFVEQYFKDNVKELIECKKKVGYKEDELTRSKEELIRIAEETDYTEYEKLDRYFN